jgi:hypothetical protein
VAVVAAVHPAVVLTLHRLAQVALAVAEMVAQAGLVQQDQQLERRARQILGVAAVAEVFLVLAATAVPASSSLAMQARKYSLAAL